MQKGFFDTLRLLAHEISLQCNFLSSMCEVCRSSNTSSLWEGKFILYLKINLSREPNPKGAKPPWYSELQDIVAGCLLWAWDSQVCVRYPSFLSLGGRDVGQEFWKAFQYYCWERVKQVPLFLCSFLACVFSQAVMAVANWTGKQIHKTVWRRTEIWVFHNQPLRNRHK